MFYLVTLSSKGSAANANLLLPKHLLRYAELASILLLISLCVKFKLFDLGQHDVIYVLVVSYSRSGSTFLGDLLAANSHSVFLFEPDLVLQDLRNSSKSRDPLLYLKENPFCLSNTKNGFKTNTSDEAVLNALFISSVIKCSEEQSLRILLRHKGPSIRHRSKNSDILRPVRRLKEAKRLFRESRYIVIKTIRYSIKDIKPLIDIFDQIYQAPLHVVHLVRDPRARALSLKPQLRKWPRKATNIMRYCSQVQQDLSAGQSLAKERYHLIRYEDLVFNPIGQTKKLYGSLGMPWKISIKRHVEDLVNKESLDFSPDYNTSRYFSTYRESYFSPDRWRWVLKRPEIMKIDDWCVKMMESLGYKPYSEEDDMARSLVLVVSSSPIHSLLLSDMITQHPDAALFFQPDELLPDGYDHRNVEGLLQCHPEAIETILKRQNERLCEDCDVKYTTIRKLGRTGRPNVWGEIPELRSMCLASKFRVLTLGLPTYERISSYLGEAGLQVTVIYLKQKAEKPLRDWKERVEVMPDALEIDNSFQSWRGEPRSQRVKSQYRTLCQDEFLRNPRQTARSLYQWLQMPWPDRKMEAFFRDLAFEKDKQQQH